MPARIHSGIGTPSGGQWQRAHDLMRSGQTDLARQMIDQQLGERRTLDSLMSAVDSMESANVARANYQSYRQEALQLAHQQMQSGANNPLPWVAAAKFSLEDDNDQAFRDVTSSLAQRFPNDKHSVYFQGIAAAKDGDWKVAEQQLRRAKELGIPEDSVNAWLKMAIDNQRWVWQYATILMWVILAWAIGLVVLYVVGRMLSSFTLRAARKASFVERPHGQRLVRFLYRHVITLAGLYYYLSLPMMVIVSIALPLAICYALLYVPVLSLWLIGLVLIVGVCSLLTALSGLRACFVSLDPNLPGRAIGKDEHPRLWQLVREVAERVGTRSVDTIVLVPSADVAVIERGNFLRRFRDRGERVLILGVGLLEGFSERAFCSVLAHEYGHFLNRDTAGGGVALRVNQAMVNYAERLMSRGKIGWWHLAVHFLRFYYVLFNRLTFGASRLQEIMADRVAVLAYGPAALEEGLSHAIRRSIEFSYWTSRRLEAVIRKEAVAVAFVQTAERPEVSAFEDIEKTLNELIHRRTNETDTHPSPQDRFAFARRLNAPNVRTDSKLVWDLLNDAPETVRKLYQDLQAMLELEANLIEKITAVQLRHLREIILQQPSMDAYLARASLQMERGDFAAAHADFDQALKLQPNLVEARIGKTLAFHSTKNYREAADWIATTLERFPKTRDVAAYFLLGECYRDSWQLEKAENAFALALTERPDFSGAQLALGQVRARLGKHQEAITQFTCVVARFPGNPEAYVDRAMSHEAMGQLNTALDDLRTAVALWVVYPRAHREYARLLLKPSTPDTDSRSLAVRHARVACAATIGLEQSLPILVEALLASQDTAGARQAIQDLLPQLAERDRARWNNRLAQLPFEASGEPILASEV